MDSEADIIEDNFKTVNSLSSIFARLYRTFSDASNHLNDDNISNNGRKEESIVSKSIKIIKNKDFVNEIRPQRDVESFVSNSNVCLDCRETSLESIIESLLSLLNCEQSGALSSDVKQRILGLENQILTQTIQGIYSSSSDDECQYDQSWLCTYCSVPSIKQSEVLIARLTNPTNLGIGLHNIRFFILVLAPVIQKPTKSAEEIAQTFATLFADLYFRLDLFNAKTVKQFIDIIAIKAHRLTQKSKNQEFVDFLEDNSQEKQKFGFSFGKGLKEDFSRRYHYYISDFVDGFVGPKTLHKTIATIFSLYFAIILPCIAFGVRDQHNTNNKIDARRALIGQAIGGMVFSLFGGQPLVVIMTTAPLCLLTSVVYNISEDLGVDFYELFACVGLWNALFVILYALFDVSYLMKWCTRSTEEIFGLFSFFAFLVDPIKDCINNFKTYYCVNEVEKLPDSNITVSYGDCAQQNSVLFLFLMLGTVWLAVLLYDFNKTSYLSQHMRVIVTDYALPVAVLTFSFVGTYLFRDINAEKMEIKDEFKFQLIAFQTLTLVSVFVSMALGFALSLLFFMDQNISAALVNNPSNKLKKGDAYHWDLLVVGVLNIFLSVFGLPWMNGMLPHSPIHARSLADIEPTVDSNGKLRDVVVKSRETRVTGVVTHIMIGLSLFMIPQPLDYIPVSVLNGLFIYCAIASLRGNSFIDRALLLFTEQSSYPPNHSIRRCPQRWLHLFTFLQIIQILVLCFFAFSVWPYVQMAYPVIIAILIPIRLKLIPIIIEEKYVKAVDGYHD